MKRLQEQEQLREKPQIGRYQQSSVLINKSRNSSVRRDSNSIKRQIEKNNDQMMVTKRKESFQERGIEFTPKINKRSSTLERSLDDLIAWNHQIKEKHSTIQVQQDSAQKMITMEMSATSKLCPGTIKILEKSSERDNSTVGDRLYQQAMNSQQRKEEKTMRELEERQKRMIPVINPKGQKSFNQSRNSQQIPLTSLPQPRQGKFLKKNQKPKEQRDTMKDKLNFYIQTKYQLSNKKSRQSSQNDQSPLKTLSLKTCSPTYDTEKSIKNLQGFINLETSSSQISGHKDSHSYKQLSVKSATIQDISCIKADAGSGKSDKKDTLHNHKVSSALIFGDQQSMTPLIQSALKQPEPFQLFPIAPFSGPTPHQHYQQQPYSPAQIGYHPHPLHMPPQHIHFNPYYPQHQQQMYPQTTTMVAQDYPYQQQLIMQQLELLKLKLNSANPNSTCQLSQQHQQQLPIATSRQELGSRLSENEEEDLFKYSIDEAMMSQQNLLMNKQLQ